MSGDQQLQFVYTPLSTGEIRLLFVHFHETNKASWSLRHVRLHDYTGALSEVEFDALSYTWGDESHDYAFVLDNRRELRIHENLNEALPCLARRPGTLPIWIDAVCINQSDEAEKRSQIALMNKIYRCASRVLIWLGPATEYTEQAISLLPDIGRVGEELRSSPQYLMETLESRGLPEFSSPVWSAIYQIVDNTWFTRLWVLQESALAKSIICLCGDYEIDWEILKLVAMDVGMYINKLHSTNKEITHFPVHDTVFLIRDTIREQETPNSTTRLSDPGHLLRITILSTHHHQCSNDRDRVFGTLGFIPDDRIKVLRLYDEDLSTKDLYSRFCWFLLYNTMLKTENFWCFLSMATAPNKMNGLPSWCPDLHTQASESRNPRLDSFADSRKRANTPYNAGRPGSKWIHEKSNFKELCLPGIVFDSVVAVYTEMPSMDHIQAAGPDAQFKFLNDVFDWEHNLAMSTLGSAASSMARDDLNLTQEKLSDYFGALLADITKRHQPREVTISTLYEFRAALGAFCDLLKRLRMLQEKYKDKNLDDVEEAKLTQQDQEALAGIAPSTPCTDFLVALGSQHRRRRVFKTLQGRLGLAHNTIHEGDMLCVFDSAPTVHVLRQTDNDIPGGKYTLNSEAYVHGMMNGEVYELDLERQDITLL